MKDQNYLSPPEIAEATIEAAIKKSKQPSINLFLLGILAGAFVAFAAEGSNMAAFNLFAKPETYGLGKALAGVVFGTGLMLVLIAGGELFTGNTMMIAAVLDGKIKISSMLRNWFFVYFGNFIGSVLIAYLMNKTGLFHSGKEVLGAVTIKIATYKVGLTFSQAFYLGVLCNCLVCLAVWMAYGAKDITGKIFAIFFPIWLFVTSGFEHSVANMYYIPAGILAKSDVSLVEAARQLGVTAEKFEHLNWTTFVTANLIPVTLGNIVGGGFCVAAIYWFVYMKNSKKVADNAKT